MAAHALRTSDISLPVLQKTTSSRVNDSLARQDSLDTSDDPLPAPPPELLQFDYTDGCVQDTQPDDNDQPLPPPPLPQQPPQQHVIQQQQQQHHKQGEVLSEKAALISQQAQEDEAALRLQSKYASPENILPPAQITTTNNNINNTNNINNNNNNNTNSQDINTITNNTTHLTLADNVESVIGHVKKSRGTGSVSAFSDASSDVSDATTSAPSATSSGSAPPISVPVHQGATESDIQQVDMFYRSQKTDVRVCQSLANMYLSAAKTLDRMPAGQGVSSNGESPIKSPNPTEMSMDDWDFIKTGIPVLVLNTGEHLRTRKLNIILAEKGTGFSLWEDELNVKTRYDTPHSNFHTLSLSTDPSRLVGFSFDEAKAASEFSEAITSLLPTPDPSLNNDKKKKKKKEKKPKLKYKAPRKIDISQPCCFVHVTKLERDVLGLPPSSVFPPPPSGAELSQAMLRSRSQSSELSEYSTSPSEN